MSEDDQINAILEGYLDDEPDSKLWADLADWAFAQDPEIPSSDEMTPQEAERLLDKAALAVKGLKTADQWASAARYFQAENFHGLEGPACLRAIALSKRRSHTETTAKAKPKTKTKTKAKAKSKSKSKKR